MTDLADDEFVVVCNYPSARKVRDEYLEAGKTIHAFGHTLHAKDPACLDGFIDLSTQPLNTGFYVVPNDVVDPAYAVEDFLLGNYDARTTDEEEAIEALMRKNERQLMQDLLSHQQQAIHSRFDTRMDITAASIGVGAISTFLGLYIGIVFLISCGAILALKELSDDIDSIPRYDMLRKIGAGENAILRSLLLQTGIFFGIPLFLACIHAVFGMKFATYIMAILGTENIGLSIFLSAAIILLIYGGYFLITCFCGKSIIRGRQ